MGNFEMRMFAAQKAMTNDREVIIKAAETDSELILDLWAKTEEWHKLIQGFGCDFKYLKIIIGNFNCPLYENNGLYWGWLFLKIKERVVGVYTAKRDEPSLYNTFLAGNFTFTTPIPRDPNLSPDAKPHFPSIYEWHLSEEDIEYYFTDSTTDE